MVLRWWITFKLLSDEAERVGLGGTESDLEDSVLGDGGEGQDWEMGKGEVEDETSLVSFSCRQKGQMPESVVGL